MAKEFQKLTIKDPFMFAAVMNDEKTCRRMLETILEMQILEVMIVTEKTMDYHPDYRGVRLDVLAVENETKRRFNVEIMNLTGKRGILLQRIKDVKLQVACQPADM